MNYGELLNRTWNIIWEHKFLIVLGVLVALGSGTGGGTQSGGSFSFDQPREMPRLPEIPQFRELPDLGDMGPAVAGLAIIAVIGAVLLALALWVVSTIARGGLIAGASAVDEGRSSSFSQAWSAGWRKGWRLLGIGILPAIPGFLLAVLGVGSAVAFGGLARYIGRDVGLPIAANVGILVALLTCILLPFVIVLGLLRTFANRACMLEDTGVFRSYRRGLEVLLDHLGSALVLFLIQIGISILLGIAGILFGFAALLCCILWPLLLLVQGGIAAYFSTMWTLAWRGWTGVSPLTAAPSYEEPAALE